MAGGCSADISRFDFPSSVSLNDDSGSTGAIPAPASDRSAPEASSGAAYFPPAQPDNAQNVRMSALPDASPQPPQAQPSYAPSEAPSRPYPATPPAAVGGPPSPAWPVESRAPLQSSPAPSPAAPSPYGASATAETGEQIEVRPGDTLYGLSKRHHVSLTELMAANDLKGPALKPGQKLYLPAAKGHRTGLSTTETAAAQPSITAAPAEPAPADWTGTYVMQPGDSLYAVARRHNVKPADLQKYNGVSDVRRLRPGTVLKMPAGAGTQVATNYVTQTDAAPAPVASADPAAPRVVQSAPPAQPTILNSQSPAPAADGKQTVAVNTPNSATDGVPKAAPGSGSAAETGKLRWPAQGKVIAGFGQRPDGTHNDGVNLAVPMGTEVHAAEGGVVAYAGNELKGYGNLILLRHDNGWVTAYAHSEELLVKRGDKFMRGQVIAKAGKTGQVDQPQVHFELRQGQRPVDPTPFMEKL